MGATHTVVGYVVVIGAAASDDDLHAAVEEAALRGMRLQILSPTWDDIKRATAFALGMKFADPTWTSDDLGNAVGRFQ